MKYNIGDLLVYKTYNKSNIENVEIIININFKEKTIDLKNLLSNKIFLYQKIQHIDVDIKNKWCVKYTVRR